MCTSVRLQAENGAVVYARTLEFGRDIQSNILVVPRNFAFTGTSISGKPGLQWRSKYAVVGANLLDQIGFCDGVNEKGLAGGLFYFPDYAQYEEVSNTDAARSIAPWEIITYLLTTCASITEVKDALTRIRVPNVIFGPWGIVPPVHAIVHDVTGASLVIEYINGSLVIHNNPFGVITNAPQFEWHLTHLRNYIQLSPFNCSPIQYNGITFSPLGQGSGMLGLPGDFTSPSRFVRAFVYSKSIGASATEDEARDAAFHILNLFNIPLGTVRENNNGHVSYDHTQWTSACDLRNKRFYWHTYHNRQIQMVDLTEINLDAVAPTIIKMQSKATILDATPK